ncbi:hypothetical protein Pcinc_004851 [Petrolisthes cinctipes]|uniref:RNA-directed DNA polymerase n=1 Tax=Petrolisthes cinctipes TaxID=88211 RepID=A0AAE1GDZ1_PETCI|nr:hypothetical protein Pcinc_004851 [Petrolisthes cinctipes]
MQNPVSDLVIGNIPGVKNACSVEISTQTGAAAVTRGMAHAKKTVVPLQVTTAADLVNCEDVIAEQASDPSLALVRKQALEGESRDRQGIVTSYVRRRNRFYRRTVNPDGEERVQFLVPEKYRQAVFTLGHHSILGGHMGMRKTIDRIQSHFYWPGMGREIGRLLRSCDVCQKTCDRGRVKPAPLKPLPLISESFERVAVDIVGPIIPRATDGAKYILTCVDFATRWPEAVPLRDIEATTVAEALLDIFCRVGIPKQVLSDRGSQFTSTMMEELWRLLSVKGLRTTPYHPMCNGLCERFNGTLKKMLRRMAVEQPREWSRYISPLLFAYREAPQASLQFSPFELVYGKPARGPLQVLRELWDDEESDSVVKTTYSYVIDLAERLQQTCEIAKQELAKAKEIQKSYYDRKTKLRTLQVGGKCLVLLPTAHNKLLAQWKGPFEVVKKVNDLNYIVKIKGEAKRFHINMLKEYYTTQQGCTSIVTTVGAGCCNITSEQSEVLSLVRGHFSPAVDMVSAAVVIPEGDEGYTPRRLKLVKIDRQKYPPGRIARNGYLSERNEHESYATQIKGVPRVLEKSDVICIVFCATYPRHGF